MPSDPAYGFDLESLAQERRRILVLEGPDAERFVQGLVSADLRQLADTRALPASLLTVKGKLLSDAVLWQVPKGPIYLAVPEARADDMQAHIDRHIIMDDVQLSAPQDLKILIQCGPPIDQAPQLAPGVQVRSCSYPLLGTLYAGPAHEVAQLAAMLRLGAAQDFERLRVEQGCPAWGRELSQERLPPEAGFTMSVSYDKGCFMGQEPLARIHARGQVNRVLVRVEGQQGHEIALPCALSSQAREQAGTLSTWSREIGRGLAVVHRSLAQPGQALDGAPCALTVCSSPIGDDVGLKKAP